MESHCIGYKSEQWGNRGNKITITPWHQVMPPLLFLLATVKMFFHVFKLALNYLIYTHFGKSISASLDYNLKFRPFLLRITVTCIESSSVLRKID